MPLNIMSRLPEYFRSRIWRYVAVTLVCGCLLAGCSKQTGVTPANVSAVPPSGSPVGQSTLPTSPPLRFEECASALGIDFTYKDGAEHELYSILESLGGGVGVLDYDADGRLDLYLTGGGSFMENKQPVGLPSALFRQVTSSPAATYVNVSVACRGVESKHYSHGAAITDYDNDGFDDVLVTGYGGVQLFHNLGEGTFEEVGESAGLQDTLWSSSAGWGDLNGDGANDLYVAHYVNWSPENDPPCAAGNLGKRDVCPPRKFDGLKNILYLSDGAGGFIDPGEAFGDVSMGKSLGVALADVDLDGDLDVYVANDTVMNSLLINESEQKLVETGATSGTGYGDTGRPDGSMGIDVGDFNGDGRPDIWVTNYENEIFALYRNFNGAFFQHVSRSTGIAAATGMSVGWGTVLADLDLDGDEDMFAANGHVIRYPTNSPLFQEPLLLLNERGQRFKNVARMAGTYMSTPHMARGCPQADFDRDGDVDLAVSQVNQPVAILRNESPRRGHWIELELIGTSKSRWAEGAWVEIAVGDQKILRMKKGGTSYASTSDRTIHAGLGDHGAISSIAVHWPSGEIQQLKDVSADQRIIIVEGMPSPHAMAD
jgi:hypothetical protein